MSAPASTAKIKVAIRLRPFSDAEKKNGYQNNLIVPGKQEVQVAIDPHNSKAFKFDYVFPETYDQRAVYNGCGIDSLIDKAIEGYHSTIFAYGQTGSGKTYTMQGGEAAQQLNGIIPQAVSGLFEKISTKAKQRTFSVSVSFLQIYNERIFDLLNPASLNPKTIGAVPAGLRLRWNKNQQFSVQNLFVFECGNFLEFTKFFMYGLSNRITASHKLNVSSSRSHTILTVRVQSFDNLRPNHVLTSKIELVDLAGSERIGLTGTEGRQAKESIDINKSLFTLRQVISTLSQTQKTKNSKDAAHIPYRDSKLTSILKQSIGGNSFCLMVACISPNDAFLEENISTLTYASKAAVITNKPVVNDDPRNRLIQDLRSQIEDLTKELQQANKHIEIISQMPNAGRDSMMSGSQTARPGTHAFSQRSDSPEKDMGLGGTFKRKLNDKLGASYEQFSERLVESINMVRQLLKSNKQLRQQLQTANKCVDQTTAELYDLQRENERLRQTIAELKSGREPYSSEYLRSASEIPTNPTKATPRQLYSQSSSRKQRPPSSQKSQNNNTSGPIFFTNQQTPIYFANNPTQKILNNTFDSFNSFEINQFYINNSSQNDTGLDSMPTNFNKRESSSSHTKKRNNSASNREEGNIGRGTVILNTSNSVVNNNNNPNVYLLDRPAIPVVEFDGRPRKSMTASGPRRTSYSQSKKRSTGGNGFSSIYDAFKQQEQFY